MSTSSVGLKELDPTKAESALENTHPTAKTDGKNIYQVEHPEGQAPTLISRVGQFAFAVIALAIFPIAMYQITTHIVDRIIMGGTFTGSRLSNDDTVRIGDLEKKVSELEEEFKTVHFTHDVQFKTAGGRHLKGYIVRNNASKDDNNDGKWVLAFPPAGHSAASYGKVLADKWSKTGANVCVMDAIGKGEGMLSKLFDYESHDNLTDAVVSSFMHLTGKENAHPNDITLTADGEMATAFTKAVGILQNHFTGVEQKKEEVRQKPIAIRTYTIDAPISLIAHKCAEGLAGTIKAAAMHLFSHAGKFNLHQAVRNHGVHGVATNANIPQSLGAKIEGEDNAKIMLEKGAIDTALETAKLGMDFARAKKDAAENNEDGVDTEAVTLAEQELEKHETQHSELNEKLASFDEDFKQAKRVQVRQGEEGVSQGDMDAHHINDVKALLRIKPQSYTEAAGSLFYKMFTYPLSALWNLVAPGTGNEEDESSSETEDV